MKCLHGEPCAHTAAEIDSSTVVKIIINGMARPTQDSYPDNIVPLFGILSKSAKEKENWHFCLYEITKNEIHTMDTPCCNHAMHCNCFEEWKEMCSRKKRKRIYNFMRILPSTNTRTQTLLPMSRQKNRTIQNNAVLQQLRTLLMFQGHHSPPKTVKLRIF